MTRRPRSARRPFAAARVSERRRARAVGTSARRWNDHDPVRHPRLHHDPAQRARRSSGPTPT